MTEQQHDQTQPVLQCKNLKRSFQLGPETLHILKGTNLDVYSGERVAIMGASGAGKSTLLNLLGALDEPDEGEVMIVGQRTSGMSESQRARLRNRSLGFVFQFHHLLPEFSALENVSMPLWLRGDSKASSRKMAQSVLEEVGLGRRQSHKPSELSGGERQRVAIARALAGSPQILLMDEPTGNLDRSNALRVLELIEQLNQRTGSALILVTHDREIASHMDRQLELIDGQLVDACQLVDDGQVKS